MADTTTKKYVQKLNDYLIRDEEAHTKIATLEAADLQNVKLATDQTITGNKTYTGEAIYKNRFTLTDYFSFQDPNGRYMVSLTLANEGSGTNNNLVIPVKSGTLATTDDIVNEVAKIINDSDPSDLDTLEEIAAWIKNDTTGAAALANKINEAVTDITTLEAADANSVKKTPANGEPQTITGKLQVNNLIIPNTDTSNGIGFGTTAVTHYALKAKELPSGVSGPITISLPQVTKASTLITKEMLGASEMPNDADYYKVKYADRATYDGSGNTITSTYATKNDLANVQVAATYTASTKTLNFTNVTITEN